MRLCALAVVAAFSLTAPAIAQSTGGGSVPSEIGNRANGRDYQPTPGEVAPRERAAGVQPSTEQERENNKALGQIDKQLLWSEGLSPQNAPKLTDGH